MNRYHVKIDDSVLPETYSFDELIENGLLDERDEHIQVKLIEEREWVVAERVAFPKRTKDRLCSNGMDEQSEKGCQTKGCEEYIFKLRWCHAPAFLSCPVYGAAERHAMMTQRSGKSPGTIQPSKPLPSRTQCTVPVCAT